MVVTPAVVVHKGSSTSSLVEAAAAYPSSWLGLQRDSCNNANIMDGGNGFPEPPVGAIIRRTLCSFGLDLAVHAVCI